MASGKNGTLYIGVTGNLVNRVFEHKNHVADSFTKQYSIHELVYYEVFENIESAIRREKAMKKWNRYWKIKLINTKNSSWRDLYEDILK